MRKELWQEDGFVQLFFFRILRGIAAGTLVVAFPYFVLSSFPHGELLLGIFYAVGTVASAGAGFIVGAWFDRRPTRILTLIVVSLLAFGLLMLAVLPHNFAVVLIASALAGVAATGSMAGGGSGGIAAPIQGALVAHLIPDEQRTETYAFLTFIAGFGAAAGVGLSGIVATEPLFLLGVAASFLSLIPIVLLPQKAFLPMPVPINEESRAALRNFSVTGILNGFSQGLAIPFLIPFLILRFHAPEASLSFAAATSSIIGSFALLTAPWFDRHFGLVKSMILTRGASIAALLGIVFIPSYPAVLALFIIFPSLRVAALPVQQRAITNIAGEGNTGTVLGANQGTRLISAAGGSALAGVLFDHALVIFPFLGYALIAGSNLALYKKFFGAR